MPWADIITRNGRAELVTEAIFGSLPCWYLRAAANGEVIAAVAQAGPGTCQVVDSLGHAWDSGQIAFGVNCVGIQPLQGGHWLVVWMQAPNGGTYGVVTLDAALTPTAGPVSNPSPYGPTSQGFLDITAYGQPTMTDQNSPIVLGGHTIGHPTTRGSWTVGDSYEFFGVCAFDSASNRYYQVYAGNVQTPSHLTLDGSGLPAVSVSNLGLLVGFAQFVPVVPVPPDPTPIPPKPIPPTPTPIPPHEDTTMTTCAIRTLESKTYIVAEMDLPVPTWNARATSPDGPWQTFDLISYDKGQTCIVRCHGTNKYLSVNGAGEPVAYPDAPHVWKVTQTGSQWGLYAEGFGWLVIEQAPSDGPLYRASIRAKDQPMSAWTTFEATDKNGKVIAKPF